MEAVLMKLLDIVSKAGPGLWFFSIIVFLGSVVFIYEVIKLLTELPAKYKHGLPTIVNNNTYVKDDDE